MNILITESQYKKLVKKQIETNSKPSVIFDYATGPKWAQKARDEVREIAPGLYLGIMYFRDCPCPKMGMFFALEKCPCKP